MNTYACWHQGRPGYCFEHPRSGWWFVPGEGQADSEVRRYLYLEDFVFANLSEWRLEKHRKHGRATTPWWRQCLQAIFSPPKPRTVAGLLLLPVRHL